MSLVEFAEKELRLAGMFDDDVYEGMLANAVMDLIRVFSDQGHSGMSAEFTMQMFERVGRFKPLTPLTDNPDEWIEVGPSLWQATRDSEAFSNDGGKTYRLNSDHETLHRSLAWTT